MRFPVFFMLLFPVFFFGCSKNIHSAKIEDLEKRIKALESIQISTEKFENIQQTIPIIEALPLTIQNVERIDQQLIELSNDLKNHHHKSS